MDRRRSRSRCLTVSIDDPDLSQIQEAASLNGATIEEFILAAAADRAGEMLDEQRHVAGSDRAFLDLVVKLAEPAVAVPALQELFALPPLPLAERRPDAQSST